MKSNVKIHKKPQRSKTYELEPEEWVEIKTSPPKKRNSIRKYYPMKITHNSLEENDYFDIAPQIIGLEPHTILTSEGIEEWIDEDDDI